MTAIILINWNGADDTLACLASLERASGDFCVVVADNGSTDDSPSRLKTYIAGSPLRVHLLPLGRNWGFAVGNNRAIDYARKEFSPDSYLLLNNDTEVAPDFLEKLQAYHAAHPNYKVLGPIICYWSEKNRIWSCGGRLVFGSRKSYFRDADVDVLPDRTPMPVSFISGCALFAEASLVDEEGRLLNERFFFGEEDYEFALRMRRKREKMMVLRDAVIWHKVASSARRVQTRSTLGRDYLYYLGRLIAARDYYNPLSFLIIRLLTVCSCRSWFVRDGLSSKQAGRLAARLFHEARTKEAISYDDYQATVLDGSYFSTL